MTGTASACIFLWVFFSSTAWTFWLPSFKSIRHRAREPYWWALLVPAKPTDLVNWLNWYRSAKPALSSHQCCFPFLTSRSPWLKLIPYRIHVFLVLPEILFIIYTRRDLFSLVLDYAPPRLSARPKCSLSISDPNLPTLFAFVAISPRTAFSDTVYTLDAVTYISVPFFKKSLTHVLIATE